MPASRKCEECLKIKRCIMHVVGEAKIITYVCRPCARKLGYSRKEART